MSSLLLDQFNRLLGAIENQAHGPELERSGFLDLLRDEADGGASSSLQDFFPLVLAAGARPGAELVIQTMVARTVDSTASQVEDCEPALLSAGISMERARAIAAAVTAGLMAGAMQELFNRTLAYAGLRKQFGREIGRFQAVQQQIAVMAEHLLATRMCVSMAFRGAGLQAMQPPRAAAAKLRAGQAALIVGSVAHAVHGAIGISEEFGLSRLTEALQRGRLAHGGESYWARRLGQLLLHGDASIADVSRNL